MESAHITLKALHGLFLSKMKLPSKSVMLHLESEASSLINVCQALAKSPGERTLQALAQNRLLELYTKELVVQFTESAQTMLSLLAWHFDPEHASISSELLQFLAEPSEQLHSVCTKVYLHYNSIYHTEVFEDFKEKLCRLLTRLPLVVRNGLENLSMGGLTFCCGYEFSSGAHCFL
ncbi:uncharacterized protein N7511_004345 [Penicillium nucicola]|uniref:uncharacterized protein n=1 Tax=Penicillium nucicola TaxID=1850975 RepID=UPI0025450E6E|nr:uncharacterized protein N7511_004345 [Penicillium nucicola]KAJ5766729.1 hypothetical protein N7511_004345 [Penicillium nucicola]